MNILLGKFKEVLFSVLPITIFVLILHFTITPLETYQIFRFLLGSLFIVIGMSIFLFGIEISISPIGTMMGSTLTKSNNAYIVGIVGLFLGFFISVAEPALHILASQVNDVTSGLITNWSLIIAVSIGLAIMVSVGLLRTVFNIALHKVLTVLYMIIFAFAIFTPSEFLVIAFDSSGATTGAMAVPFMLALSLGVSSMKKKGTSSSDDSFGLVAIASAGAILGVLIMSFFYDFEQFTGDLNSDVVESTSIFKPFIDIMPSQVGKVLVSLTPLLVIFIFFQLVAFKLPKRTVKKVFKGMLYTLIGLVIFLTGVDAGFMEVGKSTGYLLASLDKSWLVILIGFILGVVIIMAEPAVYILNKQIEDVTSGSLKRSTVTATLGLGVGVAVALAIIRVLVPWLQLWHYLLPGYLIALTMMYFVPKLFVGIAFDSGGVASGPMIGTFIFAFVQGVTEATEGANIITDGFGMIAMVALTPLIALQILGLIYKVKSRKGGL
ncbi:MAG: hypothetical protein K0Q49_2232 [Haloplasmataceae bacterium]|nr:hypothetical protein [Haloplasmataceae bacterium]